jgi:hypothetical protein
MNKTSIYFFTILLSVNCAFSTECDTINKEIENYKNIRIGHCALLGITIAGFCLGPYFLMDRPAPGATQSDSYQKTRNIIAGISLTCAICLPFEIILFIKNNRKISKLNDTLELKCKKN